MDMLIDAHKSALKNNSKSIYLNPLASANTQFVYIVEDFIEKIDTKSRILESDIWKNIQYIMNYDLYQINDYIRNYNESIMKLYTEVINSANKIDAFTKKNKYDVVGSTSTFHLSASKKIYDKKSKIFHAFIKKNL